MGFTINQSRLISSVVVTLITFLNAMITDLLLMY